MNHSLIEREGGGEVEAVEALDRPWEPGLLDPALDGSAFPLDHLQLGQAEQVAGVVDALGGALARQLVMLAQVQSATAAAEAKDDGCDDPRLKGN